MVWVSIGQYVDLGTEKIAPVIDLLVMDSGYGKQSTRCDPIEMQATHDIIVCNAYISYTTHDCMCTNMP